ncbi:hypothetical protein EJB05_38881, partial [Eragrostis curvula]
MWQVGAVMARVREAAAAGAAVDAGELLRSFTNDLACRAVMGESFRSEGRNRLFRELVADTSPLLAGFNVEEFFPFLARFGVVSKMVRTKSERVKRRWDEMLDRVIQDHESRKYGHGASAEDDFIHVLLSVREEYRLTRDQMKAILLPIAMANLVQQLAREITAPRAWFLLLFPLFFLLARYSLATLFTSNRRKKRERQDQQRLPPSPPALPVLGHLHLVGSVPHVSLRGLAKKHGYDLMLLRLGAMPVAEAVLRTHDHVFASRPHSVVAEVVLYGPSDIGFAPYGDYWRQTRKVVTTHLLSVKRVQAFRRAREEQVSTAMAQISEAAAAATAVDVGELLGSFTNDLACRAVMGESFRSEGRNKLFRQLVVDTSPLLGGFNVEEFFPFLAHFGVISKVVRTKSERLRRRWDDLLDRLIQDHDNESAAAGASDPKDSDDFIHVLLSVRQEYGLTREQMKAILLVSTRT